MAGAFRLRFLACALAAAALFCAAPAMAENASLTFIEGTPSAVPVEGPQFLLDDDIATKWCVRMRGECYVIFKAQQAVSIDGYVLVKANDDVVNRDRSPRQWTLYGANGETAPKRKDKAWEVIDSHDDPQDRTMSENADWNSYAFVRNGEIPAYEYYMLVVSSTMGDPYLQLSELQLITGRTLEAHMVVTDNPEKAIAAMGELVYNEAVLELIPSADIPSRTVVLGGGLTPIRVSDSRVIRFRLKDGMEWPEVSSISISITSAYDINEARVGQLKYSQFIVSGR